MTSDALWTADDQGITADSLTFNAGGGLRQIPEGWPCATLSATPPSVVDRQSDPSADDLLPQILALTPRGPAWGTDEAGDGTGASPVMRSFWRGIAAWAAEWNSRAFGVAMQSLPSAISFSLSDWEREYGLPDACLSGQGGTAARIMAVRARFGSVGGASPAYFVCLAQSVGYDITIEEPTQFLVDVSELVGPDLQETWFVCDSSEIGADGDAIESFSLTSLVDEGDQVAGGIVEDWFTCDGSEIGSDGTAMESFDQDPNGTVWKFWVVHVQSLGETWFRPDDGEVAADPLEGFLPASDLECLLRRQAPTSTRLIFDYEA